ncbi:hypothetical protein IQ260_03655 [Leptolyngbya cf. ectocarpi LEGE 11479]|uniref:Transferase n=1 Tax=Leptolyngbya cf. ectocarpi LEGE 11479 TaxID=1828722 RepID=A0A928ZQS5_LEPEC|nr:hypothetical protein [Leptolyngbya ectocarpi]MBE9065743.1 hypothetical protein [Leptolyngbya cf. ectocarpi LEGE 11479]
MEPSPLHFVSHTHYYRGGDVVIDASAAIAPGVVFRAASTGSIRIGPGVCVGAGVVIQAKQGCVMIESGVSLGTGVLIVGHGHVGRGACVGPSSTLINPAIAANEIVPPCSLVEPGVSTSETAAPRNGVSGSSAASHFQSGGFTPSSGPVPSMPMPPRTSPTVEPQSVSPKAVHVPDIDSAPSSDMSAGAPAAIAQNRPVYGRDHVKNLLSALFPYRQSLNNGDSSAQSENGS